MTINWLDKIKVKEVRLMQWEEAAARGVTAEGRARARRNVLRIERELEALTRQTPDGQASQLKVRH